MCKFDHIAISDEQIKQITVWNVKEICRLDLYFNEMLCFEFDLNICSHCHIMNSFL